MKPPTLYLITEKRVYESEHGTLSSLKAACEKAGIPYEQLAADEVALADIRDMLFEPGSLLYRVSTNLKSTIIGSMLITLHPGVFTTIYYPEMAMPTNRTFWELCMQEQRGIEIIPTLIVDETWQRMDTEALSELIAQIDGFPIVMKKLGLSHGQGVGRVDTAEELQRELRNMNFTEYDTIVRKYLADYRHYRLIVIDGEVVAAHEYHKPEDDFRTNASKTPIISPLTVDELPVQAMQAAVEGVAIRQSILGGVDILVDQATQVPYLAEVNVPCYYPRTESVTHIDISGKLIAALLRKREREHPNVAKIRK